MILDHYDSSLCRASIFSATEAFQILKNDLIIIITQHKELGFTVTPVEDNIYHWSIKLELEGFESGSPLRKDLQKIYEEFNVRILQYITLGNEVLNLTSQEETPPSKYFNQIS